MSGFPGLKIGHATDPELKSGVTVFLPDQPAAAAVQVTGGGPASREIELLKPGNTVERVDAIVLSGGSVFGLAAADGIMAWLAARGRGYAVRDIRVPIVPGASLFDLANGGDKARMAPDFAAPTYQALGRMACDVVSEHVEIGSVGAGTGATTADLKGGLGMAETTLPNGIRLAAYAAVNALGRTTLGSSPYFRAAAFENGAEFGGLGFPSQMPPDAARSVTKRDPAPQASTTLAVVATDAALTRGELTRVAVAAHDGIALAIYPAHTPFDGDTIFTLSTAARGPIEGPEDLLPLCSAATATLARAIAIAVYSATPAPGDRFPTWRQRYDTSKHGA